jgi:hypothetical protein
MPPEIKILRANRPDERAAWQEAWNLLPPERRDVYFSPGYVQASEAEGRGAALCAVVTDANRLLLYPFLEVPLGDGLKDIETPYGYGGPIVNADGEEPGFLEQAWRGWDRWCAEQGVVGEFTRFHPLIDNHRWASEQMSLRTDRQTVIMCLDRYPQAVWNEAYFRRHRNMLRKAERAECRFERILVDGQLEWFSRLYAETQERLQAQPETQFGIDYFEALADQLRGHSWLGIVRKGADILAAVMVIEGEKLAHSHLMGDRRGAIGGATNLVYHGIALDAAGRGLQVLHMGGGRSASEDDPLFKFKASLGPDRGIFQIGTRCHNPVAYERLSAEWEGRHGPRPPGYFLFYRLPGKTPS